MKEVKFKEWTCVVEKGKYGNGNVALQLFDEEGPVATATMNLGEKLPEGQAYIKNYSENEGMLKALEEAGIVVKVLRYVTYGYVTSPLCILNLEGL